METNGLLTLGQAAILSGIHRNTLRYAVKNGRLPSTQVSGYTFIDIKALAGFAPRSYKKRLGRGQGMGKRRPIGEGEA